MVSSSKVFQTNVVSKPQRSSEIKIDSFCSMAIKLQAIAEETKRALSSGCCVVIGLQSTGEAGLQASLKKNRKINSFLSVCRHIALQFLENHFPTIVEKTVGNCACYNLFLLILYCQQNMSSEKVEDEWCIKVKDQLQGYISKLDLPNG